MDDHNGLIRSLGELLLDFSLSKFELLVEISLDSFLEVLRDDFIDQILDARFGELVLLVEGVIFFLLLGRFRGRGVVRLRGLGRRGRFLCKEQLPELRDKLLHGDEDGLHPFLTGGGVGESRGEGQEFGSLGGKLRGGRDQGIRELRRGAGVIGAGVGGGGGDVGVGLVRCLVLL